MEAKELLRMNTPKLREEAMKIPGIVGVTAMKKEELIRVLAKAHGIEFEHRTASAEKTEVKKRIRALKAQRDDALARKAYKELKQIRRGIRTLKRRTRALARAAKAGAAATPAQAS
ncbi:MAG: transcription termination factor Rho [Thermodesulfobacteriota bacterium]|jgi:protein-arginine kinase activator protein McsA